MQIIKTFTKGTIGNWQRSKFEDKIITQGYRIASEEEVKEWEWGSACCLALIFFPLIFIKTKKIKVIYVKENN